MFNRPAIKLLIGLLLAFFSSVSSAGFTGPPGTAYAQCEADRNSAGYGYFCTGSTDTAQRCLNLGGYVTSKYTHQILGGDYWDCDIPEPEATPEECSAQTGSQVSQTGTGGIDSSPDSIDVDGCQYTNTGGIGAEFPSDGTWANTYTSNGSVTQEGDGDGDTATPLEDTGGQNCISSGDSQVCYSPMNENEGTLNGEHIDLSKLDPSKGTFLPGGSYVGGSDAPAPQNSDGSPADPDAVISVSDGEGGSDKYNYHQNGGGTVSSSNADAVTAGATTSAAQSLDEIEKGICGIPGKPECNVKVNEAGTPDGSGVSAETDAAIAGTGIDDFISNLGQGITPDVLDPVFTLPTATSCQTLSFSWRGTSIAVPDVDWCARLETTKGIIAYMLYFLTAIGIFEIVMRRPT